MKLESMAFQLINLEIYCKTARHFDGRPVKYLPKHNRRKYQRLQARKTGTNIDAEEACFVPYQVKRHHPAVLARQAALRESVPAAKPLPRYLMPAGQPTRVLPTPSAIKAFTSSQQGGTVFFIEGYKKAVALDRLGFEAIAFLGITHYKLDAETREYLKVRRPERVVISYDADALQHKSSSGKLRSRRVEDFRNSAARFAQQFFEFIETEELKTTLHFQMVDPDAPEKGIDDLVYATGDRAGIAQELKILTESGTYFKSFRLYKTSYEQRLNQFFGLNLYRSFWKRFRNDISEQPFAYKGATYRAAHFGNLFNNHKQHFELLTDPFRIDLPRISFQIQRFSR